MSERCIRMISKGEADVNVAHDRLGFSGYAIVFNSPSQDLGGFKEIIAPSAVTRTLKSGANVDALVDHQRSASSILGSTDSGLLTLRADRRGLRIDLSPPDTTDAIDLLKRVKAGLIKGMSFAFRVARDPATGEQTGADWNEDDDGTIIRTVNDMTFDEVSIVLNPAYVQTEIQARSHGLDVAALEEFRASRTWKPSLGLRERMARASMR